MAKSEGTEYLRSILKDHKRIDGPLGDSSQVDPEAPLRDRYLQRRATMSPDEVAESLARVVDFVEDTCPRCAGSLAHKDHSTDCPIELDLLRSRIHVEEDIQTARWLTALLKHRVDSYSRLMWFWRLKKPNGKQGLNNSGQSFDTLLAFDDYQMEEGHSWVQWLFPLPEPSKAQPSSPVMSEADLQMFKADGFVINRVLKALNRWMQFMENTTHWLVERDHNHLRITRIIRFLTLIDLKEEAEQVCCTAIERMTQAGVLTEQTKYYWEEALKAEPDWLKP